MRFPVMVLFTVLLTVLITFNCFEVKAEEDLTFGSWTLGRPAPGHLLATHASLLRNNKILVVGGSSYNFNLAWGKEDTRFYYIANDRWSARLSSPAPYGPDDDAFCSGHAHDNTGGVIFQGGLLNYERPYNQGIGNSARYDAAREVFTQITGGVAHWYPTLVAGVNDMFNFPGVRTGSGEEIQKLTYGETSWISTGVRMTTKAAYPRVTLLPNGKLFVASPADGDRKNYFFDPGTNTTALAGTDVVPEESVGIYNGSLCSGVLLPLVSNSDGYPQMRFALINGARAWIKDLGQANPIWQVMGTRPPEMAAAERVHGNATLLPTGQVFVSGGVIRGVDNSLKDADAVLKPEIYDPETDKWLATSAATVPRNYHGVALLLPDGRVWTAGASQNNMNSSCGAGNCDNPAPNTENTEERVEIFTPWYWGRPDRPVVTACPATMEADGREYKISIGGPQGTLNVDRVVLMRAGSVTHAFDSDQRLIQLGIVSKTTSIVTVKSPFRADAAPPGDYMLFALRKINNTGFKRWVPSSACWTRIATPNRAVGAPVWRYNGIPCTPETCSDWQRLSNSMNTAAIAAAGTHNEQALYQLYNDGSIWRFTGGPCQGHLCGSWQRLDRSSKTAAIAAAGNQLYQLQNDGWILRYMGTPCSGEICQGWQRLDRNAKTVAIAAAGNQLYQLHNDGEIWRYTGTPCSGESCTGWQRIGNNIRTAAIAAGGSDLYQLLNDGNIWRFTGTPCSSEGCFGWQLISNNVRAVAIAAGASDLYQQLNDGQIWRYTGTPCSSGGCFGWQLISNNVRAAAIAAGGGNLYQLLNDGQTWRYNGTPCSSAGCPGWQLLDNNPRSGMIAASDSPMMGSGDTLYKLHTDPLYQMHRDGKIWRYTGTECDGDHCPGWERLEDNTGAMQIVAAGAQVFQRKSNGHIWRYTGTPCSGQSCLGWQELDNKPNTKAIAAAGIQLFKLHTDGKIWRYSGTPCSGGSCPGWELVSNNSRAVAIAAAPTGLSQLLDDGQIWRYTGTPCSGNVCPGWQLLSNSPDTSSILAVGTQLFQLKKNGLIWRFTGTPCNGSSCWGWEQLNNNPSKAITGAATQLYQLNNDGGIWRYTGTPCNGTSCPGWEKLDNNTNTSEIVATGNHLYQRHSNGRIFRYLGRPCAGGSCLGWQELDNNHRTTQIAAGGFN